MRSRGSCYWPVTRLTVRCSVVFSFVLTAGCSISSRVPDQTVAPLVKLLEKESPLLLVSVSGSGEVPVPLPPDNEEPAKLPFPREEVIGSPEVASAFTLRQAVDFGLRNNPRLRAALAVIERAQGQEQAAFAPFLPQIDFLTHYGVTSRALGPASAGISGITLTSGEGTHTYAEAEVQLQWTLCDFGRRTGLYGQAIAREQIASLQSGRARETVAFDVANAYLQSLQARAIRLIQEEAVRRAESTLKDTRSRRAAGAADRDDVLRGDVQLAQAQDALDIAEEAEQAALARLNNAMGRNASLPLQLMETNAAPAFQTRLVQCLETAANQRPEIGIARQSIAGAQSGRQAAAAEFKPRVYSLASSGIIGGEHVLGGAQEGVGLHIDVPLYAGGRHRGDLRAADANVREAVATSQVILDAVSLEVTLAFRSVVTAQKRIEHLRPAITEARENLRLVGNKYRNGTATPTDIVDAETTLTRAQQQFSSASSEYLAALARLDYAMGTPQGSWL
jgi:outer membrane protein TolC